MAGNRFFTGVGDKGNTAIGSKRLDKSDSLLEAMGDVDELISYLGVIGSSEAYGSIEGHIMTIQDKLFSMNAELASSMDDRFMPKNALCEEDVKELESNIKEVGKDLPPLREFIIPGSSSLSAQLDMARSICRRAERSITRMSKEHKIHGERFAVVQTYINRLSSYLFWAARLVNFEEGIEEFHPQEWAKSPAPSG